MKLDFCPTSKAGQKSHFAKLPMLVVKMELCFMTIDAFLVFSCNP